MRKTLLFLAQYLLQYQIMIKNITLIILFLSFAACHRKTILSKESKAESPVVSTSTPLALIVVDGYGRVFTPKSKLPGDESIKADYAKFTKPFTPLQIANLKSRFKTVPPKVLYVSKQYTLQSLKGTYCIYKKKFWYWKKEDGLFYLDETYYQ